MKAVVSVLSLLLGALKHFLFISLIYTIRRAMIDASYNNFGSSSSDPFFSSSSEEFWANEHASEIAMLNTVTIALAITLGIVLLGAWIAVTIVLIRNNAIVAGIVSIIFVSVIGGILMLTVVRKKIAEKNPKPVTSPNTNTNFVKPASPSKPSCAYCDRELPKNVIICPYCGAHLTEKK